MLAGSCKGQVTNEKVMTYASQNKNRMKSCEKRGFRSLFKLSNKPHLNFNIITVGTG